MSRREQLKAEQDIMLAQIKTMQAELDIVLDNTQKLLDSMQANLQNLSRPEARVYYGDK